MSSGVDYPLGETIDFLFTTRDFDTGAPQTLGGTPEVSVYENGSTTQITAGVSLTADFDSTTGLNHVSVVATTGNGYESGKSYHLVITTGTVDSVSVVGEVVGHFTIERSAALRPTTAGRTLDVTSTGAAGVDWGNVENASTAVDLSGTDIQLCDTVTTNTDMRGTDSALLASSAPTNFGDLSITATTGRVDVASIEGSDATDQINAACDTALTDYDAVVPGDLPTNFADLSITVTTGRVDVASIEGSDATDQINAAADTALTDYDPPTKAELDSGFAALNDLSAAEVNAEVDTALNTAIPGAPTADSINERVAALDDLLESGGSGDAAAILTDTNSLNDTKVPQTLNLTASGNIGIDWANVENPTTALDLSGTDIQLVDTATDVTNRVSANTDQIDGDATAATNLKRSASGIVPSAVNDASASTTAFVTDLTETTNDHYNGRIIVFTSGSLAGQATDISDYDGSTKTVTVTALTEAPGDNDEFVIV